MSQTPQPHLLDFSSPRRPPSSAMRQLAHWQSRICDQVQESWGTLLAQKVLVQAASVKSVQLQKGLEELTAEAVGVYFSIGENLLPSMLVIPVRQIHGLIADLLDLPGEGWPVPTPLSAAEDSMLELLFQKFADAIGESWPDTHPLKCNFLETTSKPQRTRVFSVGSALFQLDLKIYSRFGEETCTWFLLKDETEELIQLHFGTPLSDVRQCHPALEELAEKIPLEIRVELGTVALSMPEASGLAVGDVLILDQIVSRPLIAFVEGQPKWAGNPVRIGSRQGFEVTHVLSREEIASALKNGVGFNRDAVKQAE
ncbi:FliM/FliN family flagellar motor switch protein [Planctomicrobium sp. SH668]|uniref:FliM/FliN family flagellar motor switch protein n=1 Tax=Planctomicrobium sp. SH668 TaxID=3448126 RepID=UPI003F5BBA0F